MAAWYVLRTIPQGELRAYKWLLLSKVHGKADAIEEVFLPLESRSVDHGRSRRRDTLVPIIRGYVFTRLVAERINWEKVEDAPGAMQFLTQDGVSIATLQDDQIAHLREIERVINEPKPERNLRTKRKKRFKFKEGLEIFKRQLDTMDSIRVGSYSPGSGMADLPVFPLCSVA
jgi:transcription antitermination factor NusG